MRITLVSPFDPRPEESEADKAFVGGVERVFAELFDRLVARGHDVTLLCSTDGPTGEWLDQEAKVVRVRRAGTILRAPIVRLASHIPKDAQVVHVAATYPFTTPSVIRRAHALRIPSVLDFHFEPVPGSAIGRVAADLYRQVGPPFYKLAHAAIVRSYAYGRRSPSLSTVPEKRWRVVPNGIDPQRFHADGPSEDGDYLLFVGRLVPYKGLSVLLDALAHGKIDMPLRIVGDGPLRRSLEDRAERLGVDIEFLGHVPDERLPELYRGARLTLLPSVSGQEAFGITLIESMACGTPVVASSLPGVKDVAEVGGLTSPPGDPIALASTIEHALDPDVLERGPALAERVHERFSWDAVTDRVLAVYDQVLRAVEGRQRTTPDEVRTVAHPRGHALLQS